MCFNSGTNWFNKHWRNTNDTKDIPKLFSKIAQVLGISESDLHKDYWPFLSADRGAYVEYEATVKEEIARQLVADKHPNILAVSFNEPQHVAPRKNKGPVP